MFKFMSHIPFADAIENCQFEMDMTSTLYMYQGHADVFIDIKLSEGVMRTVKTILKFTIILPKVLKVSAEAEVIADVEIKAWLTEKSWTWLTGLGTLEYFTRTSKPYKLDFTSIVVPAGLSATVEENTLKGNCPEDDGEALCEQYWTVTVDPNGLCAFTGSYQLNFDILCRAGYDCRADTAVLNSQVISDDTICNRLEIDIHVDAELTTRGNVVLFNNGDDIMFDLKVNSADAHIQKIDPVLITTGVGAADIVLYSEEQGGAQDIAIANDWELELNQPGPTDVIAFGFTYEWICFTASTCVTL